MLRVQITKLRPSATQLAGATVGEAHADQIREQVRLAKLASGDAVALDFAGVESASASWQKRVFNPFFAEPDSDEGFGCELSPVLLNVTAADLKEDLTDHLEGKGRALILANDVGTTVRFAKLVGRMDRAATETFQELCALRESSAQQLYERHPDRTTNQTAWNNRLAQLVEMRLARRRREGRLWIYQPVVAM